MMSKAMNQIILSSPDIRKDKRGNSFTRFSFKVLDPSGDELFLITGARIVGQYVQLPSIPLGRNYVPVAYLGASIAAQLINKLIALGWLNPGAEDKAAACEISGLNRERLGL